jgi:hypothetical protein
MTLIKLLEIGCYYLWGVKLLLDGYIVELLNCLIVSLLVFGWLYFDKLSNHERQFIFC